MHADDLLRPWLEPLLAEVEGLAPVDSHTHIGSNDPDGFRSSPGQLAASLEQIDARAFVFPMHEPGGYPPANDAVIAAAAESRGRMIPFCRVDPARAPVAEAERSLAAGARGVKLHPRAEGFRLSDAPVAELIALSAEHAAPVIVHAGRGIPALGRDALDLTERYPAARLILAHAGISDLGWIWRHLDGRPNLFFDTTWWNPADLLALFALVPPAQILYGSDSPYGTPLAAAVMTLRCALQAGLDAEQVRAVMGAQAERLVTGREALALGPAPGTGRVGSDVLLERVFVQLSMAGGRLLHGEDAEQELGLARLACDVGEDAPQAPVCRSIVALLDRAVGQSACDSSSPQAPDAQLIVTATCLAKTPAVALPPDPEPVEVGAYSTNPS